MHNPHPLFITILILLLAFIFCDSSASLGGRALTGGWEPIGNVSDLTVVEIGKFAVDEHNKEDKTSLKFEKVISGESQVVAGMNYNLTIAAAGDGVDNNYVAVVWDKPWQKFRKLVSFKGPI